MLKTRTLKTVFYAALALVVLLVLYVYLIVHASYHKLLVEKAEKDAVQYVRFLVHAYQLDQAPIKSNSISNEVAQDVRRFESDTELIKLRVFDAKGEIVFSTLRKEIGQVNEHDYFHNKVAHGEIYSKTVSKDNFSKEMEMVKTDLVETYVPIMSAGSFRGAIETYYDITASSQAIRNLNINSLVFLSVVSVILLIVLFYTLQHADNAIISRIRAEDKLREANEELEVRVADRAGELIRVNKNLMAEISERTQAQMALSVALDDMEEAKEKIDGILRSVTDGVLVVDRNELIVLMNRPAEEILGYSSAESLGHSLRELDLSDSLKNALNETLAAPGQANVDFELESAVPNRPRIFQARASALRDRDESIGGTVVLMQDVSFERQVERMKSDFLAMAAHELMTPLASIMGYSELLSSEAESHLSDAQKKEFHSFIFSKAESLSRIVDDLLDVSRIESGQHISVSKIEFDLCLALERLVTVYRDTFKTHQFSLNVGCTNCRLFADPIRLEQVVENLLSNAVKYSPNGGEIQISCSGDQQLCKFAVSDNGIGMSPEQVDHIFDKFYRADVSDTARRGIGLGMSIAKHIVDSHGGAIEVESELGKGTCVRFSLPRGL